MQFSMQSPARQSRQHASQASVPVMGGWTSVTYAGCFVPWNRATQLRGWGSVRCRLGLPIVLLVLVCCECRSAQINTSAQ